MSLLALLLLASSAFADQIGIGPIRLTGATSIADLSVGSGKLAANSVDSDKIVDSAVSTTKINTDAVTGVKILDLVVSTNKLATDAITSIKVLDAAISTNKLATDSVTGAKVLNSTISTTKLASDAVDTAKILTDSVTETKVLNAAISTAKLATDSVSEAKVLDAAISTNKLATDAVSGAKILDTAVSTNKLATDSVTSAKILNGAIATVDIAANAVTSDKTTGTTVTCGAGNFLQPTMTNGLMTGGACAAAGTGDVSSSGNNTFSGNNLFTQDSSTGTVIYGYGNFGTSAGVGTANGQLFLGNNSIIRGVLDYDGSTSGEFRIINTYDTGEGVGGGVRFLTRYSQASGYVESFRITPTGRIGLGTMLPATLFHASSGTFTLDGTSPSIIVGDAVVPNGGQVRAIPLAAQTIGSGNTITANACGTVKRIDAAGNVTTSTSDTFSTPAATNAGCCMDVINSDTADTITLDANSNFNAAADVVLTPCDAIRVCSDGVDWYPISALVANTCN